MDKETTTSVTIDRKTFARLDRLAKSNNVSKKDFLSCALEYFEKYGINPVEHESPAKEMQKLIKRCDQVIAFIRKQEQDFLRPACEAMGSTSMRVTMSMDSILTEKKFSQYQKDNDLFMRDLASLAGIREQALDRAEKAVGQSRDMLLKNQQAIYARLDAVTQRQEKIFSYIASYCRQWCTQLMGNSMYRFLSGGYEYLILLHGLFQLLDQIRCLAFVSFNVLCITVYDDIGNDQQQKNKSHQAAYLHK